MTHHPTPRILIAALLSTALLIVLSLCTGLVLATPKYDPGLVPTGEPQVAPTAPASSPPPVRPILPAESAGG